MLITERIVIGGITYMHNYSDEDMHILQTDTGIIYEDAMDPVDTTHTYEETDIPLEDEE